MLNMFVFKFVKLIECKNCVELKRVWAQITQSQLYSVFLVLFWYLNEILVT